MCDNIVAPCAVVTSQDGAESDHACVQCVAYESEIEELKARLLTAESDMGAFRRSALEYKQEADLYRLSVQQFGSIAERAADLVAEMEASVASVSSAGGVGGPSSAGGVGGRGGSSGTRLPPRRPGGRGGNGKKRKTQVKATTRLGVLSTESDVTVGQAIACWEELVQPFADQDVGVIRGTGAFAKFEFEFPLAFGFNPNDEPLIYSGRRDDARAREEYRVEAILALGTERPGGKQSPMAVIKWKGFQLEITEEESRLPAGERKNIIFEKLSECRGIMDGTEPRAWMPTLKVLLARYPAATEVLYKCRNIDPSRWPFRPDDESALDSDEYVLLSKTTGESEVVREKVRASERRWCRPENRLGFGAVGCQPRGGAAALPGQLPVYCDSSPSGHTSGSGAAEMSD